MDADTNPLQPPASLLAKVGSVIAHVEEAASPEGHEFDAIAAKSLLSDPEVAAWMAAMRKLALLPARR